MILNLMKVNSSYNGALHDGRSDNTWGSRDRTRKAVYHPNEKRNRSAVFKIKIIDFSITEDVNNRYDPEKRGGKISLSMT